MSERILVVVAHPDDETLGCGGTIVKAVKNGDAVRVIYLTDGVGSRVGSSGNQAVDRRNMAQQAGKILGVDIIPMFSSEAIPDNESDTVSRLRLARLIEIYVAEFQPDSVFTHHGGDLNVDHRRMHEATLIACRPFANRSVRAIYGMEVATSTEWGLMPFAPTCYVDIGLLLTHKLNAMACYRTEQQPFPHPRSPEAIKALAMWRGSNVGVGCAEAFEVIRLIR